MNTILLIEDDEWLASSYKVELEKLGYECYQVGSSALAMDLVDEKQPDIIVADVMLDDGTVIALLHELVTHQDTSRIPIILCSSLVSEVKLEDVSPYGVVALLDKAAVTPESLRIAVERALNDRDQHRNVVR